MTSLKQTQQKPRAKKEQKREGPVEGFAIVIVATDFSPGARLALRRAQHLPLQQGALILLTHVLPKGDREVDAPTVEALRRERMDRELVTLQRALLRLQRGDVRLQAEFRTGNPAAELAVASSRQQADLLVVGRRGESNLRQFLLGSTAEQVANAARCDVLIVGRRATGTYQRPMVALPPEAQAEHVLEAALRMLPGRPIQVVTAAHVQMEAWLWGGWSSTREILALRSAATKRARALAKTAVAPYRAKGARLGLSFIEGEPRQVLLAEADRHHADLLIVGTNKKGGRSRMRVGSVAGQVLRRARCDVLIASAESRRVEQSRSVSGR